VIGQHERLDVPEEGVDLVVREVAVDERDQVAMTAARDHGRRQRPVLPGLARDGEPEEARLVLRHRFERGQEVLDALERADHAEEQEVKRAVARPRRW
jgi:hypothetical protein